MLFRLIVRHKKGSSPNVPAKMAGEMAVRQSGIAVLARPYVRDNRLVEHVGEVAGGDEAGGVGAEEVSASAASTGGIEQETGRKSV